MSALGFFRNHTKLVIWTMVVLMGMFLLSTMSMNQLISVFSGRGASSTVIGTLDNLGIELTSDDLDKVKRDFTVYQRLGLIDHVSAAAMGIHAPLDTQMLMLNIVKPLETDGMLRGIEKLPDMQRDLNWALLTAEARAMGVRPDGVAVESFLKSSRRWGDPFDAMLIDLRQAGYLQKDVYDALANYLSVRAAFQTLSDGIVTSEDEIRGQFVDMINTRDLAIVPFEAAASLADLELDESAPQVQAEMNQLFDQCRQYFRNAPDNPTKFRFGYRLPRRLQLEYALVSLEAVANTIVPSDQELYEYWSQNKEKFAPRPKEGEAVVVPEYPEVKTQVRSRVRTIKAAAQVESISRRLVRTASELEQEPDTGISALAQAVEVIGSPAISYFGSSKWYTPQTLSMDPVLQRASSNKGTQSLITAAFGVDKFLEADKRSSARVKQGKVSQQVFQVMGQRPGEIVWSVTATEDSESPEKMEGEILEQVKADWRVMKAYDIALAKAVAAMEKAVDSGLQKAADKADVELVAISDVSKRNQIPNYYWGNYNIIRGRSSAVQFLQWAMAQGEKGAKPELAPTDCFYEAALAQPYIWGPPVLRELGNLPKSSCENLAEAVFAMEPVAEDLKTDEAAPAGSLQIIEMPEAQRVVLVQQIKNTPAYQQELYDADDNGNTLRAGLLASDTYTRRLALLKQWCDHDKIVARTGFKWDAKFKTVKPEADSGSHEGDQEEAATDEAETASVAK